MGSWITSTSDILHHYCLSVGRKALTSGTKCIDDVQSVGQSIRNGLVQLKVIFLATFFFFLDLNIQTVSSPVIVPESVPDHLGDFGALIDEHDHLLLHSPYYKIK